MARPAERYQLIERLGGGACGVVHRAFDRTMGTEVALRLVPRRHGRPNLRSEFVAIARIRHPAVVAIHDYGLTDAGSEYVAMELLAGPWPAAPLSAAWFAGWDVMLDGLGALHARGVAHGNLRPGSVLAGEDGSPRLVDGGLVYTGVGPAATKGTVAFVAPEAWSRPPDPRTDLYAVGVLMYHQLTGIPGFGGTDPRNLIAAQRRTSPPPLRGHRPDAPLALDALISALCAPSPSGRPQGTDETRDQLVEIAAELGIAIRQVRPTDLERRTPAMTATPAIGRDRELADLDRMWRDARAGRGGAAALIGEAGMGTSQLLGQLAVQAELDGAIVVELATGGVAPFAGIAELVRSLSHHAPADAVTDPVQRAALAAAAAGRALPREAGKWTVAEGVVELATAIASHAPLVILIDDVGRASAPATELITYLARGTADAAILMVAASRPPPPGATSPVSAVVRAIASCVRGLVIDVPPLSRSAITQLVGDATHRDVATQIGDAVHRASGGNPGHALAVLELMAQTGQIARVRGSWVADADVTVPLPRSPVAAARAHLAQLPAQARAVLRAAGALGPTFDRILLGQALGLLAISTPVGRDTEEIRAIPMLGLDFDADVSESGVPAEEMAEEIISVSVSIPAVVEPLPAEAMRSRQLAVAGTMDAVETALAAGVTAGLLTADPATGTFRFVDPGLTRELGDELDQTSARVAHERARDALRERHREGDPLAAAELARQSRALGDLPEAVRWSLTAADADAARGDLRGALDRLDELVASADGERLALLTTTMSRLARALGDLDAAIRHGRLAIATAGDRTGQLAIELAEHYRLRGELEPATAMANEGLTRARAQRDAAAQSRALLTLAEIDRARGEPRAAAELAAAGSELAATGGDGDTRIALDRLAASLADAAGDPRRAWAVLDTALAEAQRLDDPKLRAQVRHDRGRLAIVHGEYARANDEFDDAVAAAFGAGDLEQAARSLNNLGAATYHLGAWSQARAAWERYRKLAERAGADVELLNALNNLGSLYRDLGLFDEARSALERAAEVAARTGNSRLAATVAANLGEIDAREGDFARASERYAAARTEFERLDARGDVIETRRRQCELDLVLGRHDDALGRAIDAIREARDAGARFEEGVLHRVAARAARMYGDLESARWFVDRARDRLAQQGARYELARAIEEDGAVTEAEGETSTADRLRDEARRMYGDLGARWDLARLRPAAVRPTAIGRRESDAVAAVARSVAGFDVSRALAGGVERIASVGGFERTLVIAIDDEGRPQELHRWIAPGARAIQRGDAALIAPLVRRVAATGVADAIATATDQPELHRLGVERVLCAPLKVAGHVLGVIYFDASRPGDGGDGVDSIIDATTTLLGLALDRNRLAHEARRRGDLMSILAHEIRNPLSGILGYAEMGTEDDLGDPEVARQLLTRIRADGERLRRLLEDVMALAKREPRGPDAPPAAVDVASLARDVATSFWASCEQRAVTLSVDATSPACTAVGDADRLTQVLSNIVTNAIKFTPPGGAIKIAVGREAVCAGDPHLPPGSPTDPRAWLPLLDGEPAGEYVRVDVVDSGPGLDPTVGEQLFEKFVQGRHRGRGGLGLGLYISREIIQRHGGTIWAGNAAEGGARFSFRLPVAM